MNEDFLKIIYIAGWGRSGSTLLARILGQLNNAVHLGELRTIWTDGFKAKSTCGCGLSTRQCDVWQSIMNHAFGGLEQVDLSSMVELRRKSEARTAELLQLSFDKRKANEVLQRSQHYRTVLERLYRSIQNVCNAKMIIDDSLHPGYAYMLASLPQTEIYLIHLIRDARGCAYSWTKRQKRGLGSYSLKNSALGWNLRNIATETLKNHPNITYHQLRYEDFIRNPKREVQAILSLAGLRPDNSPFKSTSEVFLKPTHSIFGNDNRVEVGSILLKLDEIWRLKMTNIDQCKVVLLTWPMLLRYQYQI